MHIKRWADVNFCHHYCFQNDGNIFSIGLVYAIDPLLLLILFGVILMWLGLVCTGGHCQETLDDPLDNSLQHGGFHKWGHPIIHLSRNFHYKRYKPSILGTPIHGNPDVSARCLLLKSVASSSWTQTDSNATSEPSQRLQPSLENVHPQWKWTNHRKHKPKIQKMPFWWKWRGRFDIPSIITCC